MGEVEYSSETLFGVAIKTAVGPMLVDDSRSLARSTALMRDRASGAEYFFGGASVACDKQLAVRTSRFEVLERIFAMPSLHPGVRSFPAFDALSGKPGPDARAEDVLLNSKDALGGCSRATLARRCRGAVGLGLGETKTMAVRHAVFEALERHLRSSVWYRGVDVVQVGDEEPVKSRYRLRRYTVAGIAVPFCLSVITAVSGEDVFFCGSAMRATFLQATSKADNEALTMLDSHLEGRRGQANTRRSRQRFLELSGLGGRQAAAAFASRVLPERVSPDASSYTEETAAAAVLGRNCDVRYALLLKRDDLVLVRAYSPLLTWENRDRQIFSHFVISDPFC